MNNPIALPEQAASPFADASKFETAQRIGTALSASSLVPEAYRGKDKLPNVLIALEIASRIGASPLAVMQSLHIIHGRPSWSASFLIATVNACGRFTPLRFEVVGDDADAPDYKVRAFASDKDSGHECHGPWITWKMVNAEGWLSKSGSKWKTMPALMFMYRAAAFWARVYAPELSLGIHTAEEVQDMGEARVVPIREGVAELQAKLQARAAGELPPPEAKPAPMVTLEGLLLQIQTAADGDELAEAADLIRELESEQDQAAANEAYKAALARLGDE